MTKNNLTQEELEHLLPIELRLRLGLRPGSRDAFFRAYTEGFIAVGDDGRLLWMVESVTMLAYFCGRLWCGDHSKYMCGEGRRVWLWGRAEFPAKQLEQLFDMKYLRQQRFHKKNRALDDICLSVDNLFV